MSGVQTVIITEAEADQRLDRWLRKRFPQLTQVQIEKMCRKGEVRADGGRVKSNTRIEAGQKLRLPPIAESRMPMGDRPAKPLRRDDIAMIQDAVIWQDQHIIALNKPPGLPSQGGSGQGDRHVDGLAEALKFGYKERPKLVHRLDKDTSGVLLLARTDRVARGLSEAFRHRETRKIYWAAVAGVPHPRAGSIKFGLLKAGGRGGEKMRCIHPNDLASTEGAKRAHTDFMTISALANRACWVALSPITGRTHQLRAHMAEIGNPI
ncbi:MAG: RluA family pseudouridine synthase, partial [Rhodobacteraceae bacterium]|nr:RluA family pseudouridine synthase [Paracoccaceae bacterium]